MKKVLLILLIPLIILGATKYYLPVQIESSNGRPIRDATVAIYDSTGTVKKADCYWHTSGIYYFTTSLPPEKYDIKIYTSGNWITLFDDIQLYPNAWNVPEFMKAVDSDGDYKIETAGIEDEAITEPKIATEAVTESKIAPEAVTRSKIAPESITESKIVTRAVTLSKTTYDASYNHSWAYLNHYKKEGDGTKYMYIDWFGGPYTSYYNRKSYFTIYSPDSLTGTTTNFSAYVFYYDYDTGKFSDFYLAAEAGLGSDDSHGKPSIIVNNEGRVILAMDSVVAGNHNQGIIVRYSGIEDITTWTKSTPSKLKYAGVFANASYPQLFKLNGNLFCVARYGLSSTDHYRNIIWKSADGGLNWSDGYMLCSVQDADTNMWSYHLVKVNKNNTKVGVAINERDRTNTHSPHRIYYIESTDGVNWGNASGTFIKNIETSGLITRTELATYCAVAGRPNSGSFRFTPFDISFDRGGNPYIYYTFFDQTTNVRADTIAKWNGSNWVKIPVGIDYPQLSNVELSMVDLYVHTPNIFDIFTNVYDQSSSTYRLKHYRTIDGGYSFMENDITGSLNLWGGTYYGRIGASSEDEEKLVLVTHEHNAVGGSNLIGVIYDHLNGQEWVKPVVLQTGTSSDLPKFPSVGEMFFDQTSGKPIWFNGTNWVDATGTVIY